LKSAHVLKSTKEKGLNLKNHPILQNFKDVFLDEILGLPPMRYIGFYINIMPRVSPVSKAPYRMSIPNLIELKI
jgi:hypothetical protein